MHVGRARHDPVRLPARAVLPGGRGSARALVGSGAHLEDEHLVLAADGPSATRLRLG